LNIERLQQALLNWYKVHKRDLPWRKTTDPYLIWLSEIILQQTRVSQGLPYYLKFSTQFPNVHALANAPQEEVLKAWEGLGYYSRARNLHAAAKEVSHNRDGNFPSSYQGLLELKGVGDYTAAAVASFAYREGVAVVDGNVFRVLSRLFGDATPVNTTQGKKVFKGYAQKLLNKGQPDLHNQAMMELGALQCTPTKPNCRQCPVKDYCSAYAQSAVAQYPVKERKKYNRVRHFFYVYPQYQKQVAVSKRRDNIWKGLFEFPLLEFEEPKEVQEVLESKDFLDLGLRAFQLDTPVKLRAHKLSHQTLHITILPIHFEDKPAAFSHCQWIAKASLKDLAFPRPLRQFLNEKQLNLPFD